MHTMTRTAQTHDGALVNLWSDGDLADSAGRTITRHRLPYAAASIVLGEVGLATLQEVPVLIRAAASLPPGFTPGQLRAKAWGTPRPTAAQSETIMASNQHRRVQAAREHIECCRSPWCKCH